MFQQSLRLGDFGHLGRRPKAFERRSENGVGLGGAAGRLVQLGERLRLSTPVALLESFRSARCELFQ